MIWNFMWIAGDSHEMSTLIFSQKQDKVSSAPILLGTLRANFALLIVNYDLADLQVKYLHTYGLVCKNRAQFAYISV